MFPNHTQAALRLTVFVHLSTEPEIKTGVPTFCHLYFHLPGQFQHPVLGFRVNCQRGQPFQPCHRVVVVEQAKALTALSFPSYLTS